MKGKVKKYYEIHTGLVLKGEDTRNWNLYTATAVDAKSAIKKVRGKFRKGEYVESVKLITRLD